MKYVHIKMPIKDDFNIPVLGILSFWDIFLMSKQFFTLHCQLFKNVGLKIFFCNTLTYNHLYGFRELSLG